MRWLHHADTEKPPIVRREPLEDGWVDESAPVLAWVSDLRAWMVLVYEQDDTGAEYWEPEDRDGRAYRVTWWTELPPDPGKAADWRRPWNEQ